MPLTVEFDFLSQWDGTCDECREPSDLDAQTVVMTIDGKGPMHFHQICAWKRATFIFGELF